MGIKPESSPTVLKRTLGPRTVVSTSAGLTFASSTFLVVVYIGHSLTGNASWIPITIAGLLCALAAAAFTELNGMYPSASGIRLWLQRAFGEKIALVTALSYMSVVALVVGTEAFVLSHVLSDAFPRIAPPWWIFLMLTVATIANLRSLKIAGALQDVITYSVIVSIVVMSVLGLNHAHWSVPTFTHPGSVGNVASMVGFAIFLFVGFEWVTPLAEEVKDPRSIPYGMFIALGLLVICYSLISTAMFADSHVNLFGTAAIRDPIPHITFAKSIMGNTGRVVMLVTSICMSLTTFNAGLMSVSRFIQASAREHALPKKLERISSRFTPVNAIITVYFLALAVSMFVCFTQQYVVLLNVAAATESLIYAFAAACVFMLRRKEASTERPYKMWGGLWLPALTSVLFLAVGIGVFFTDTSFDYWGAGVILAVVAAGWFLYVHFVAIPRKERLKAEQAARRQSRRPRPSTTQTSESPLSPSRLPPRSTTTKPTISAYPPANRLQNMEQFGIRGCEKPVGDRSPWKEYFALNEHDRLLALQAYDILDTDPERDFDEITKLAAHTFHTPISIISLIDEKREWFKSRIGMEQTEAPRELAFCEHAYLTKNGMVVNDATLDPRFRENPYVTGPPNIRFYAGVPLVTSSGCPIGALCVIDTKPRECTLEEIDSLRMLARVVMNQLDLRRANRDNAALISRQAASEQSLRENAELLGNVLSTIPHMVFWKDRESTYLGCNARFAQKAGLETTRDVVGKTDFDLPLTQDEAEAYRNDDRQVMESGRPELDMEETCRGDGDEPTYRLTSKIALHNSRGSVVGILGISQDITERKLLEAERERLHAQTQRLLAEAIERSNRDALTGLLNHRAFHNQLEVEAERADRTGKPLAVAMMDLDNFKFFNDAYGHRAGDDVLRLIASVLGGSCRPGDCLARFGGDEFAMLLPGVNRADATKLVARMTEVLDRRGYIPPGAALPIPLRISVGIAVYRHEAATRLEAIEFADTRLRLAKGGADDTVLAADLVRNTMKKRVQGFSMLDALIAAVDNKDRYTRKHSEEVLAYSIDICQEMGLPEDIRHDTAVAALLHDVGKIGVPDPILRKPSRLTPDEFEIIKQHVTMGAIIVQAVPGFEMTLDAIRYHHERWDGGGYPSGLRGDEIPQMARIIAVADAFSAMTTDRPYRKGMTPEVALDILTNGIDTQWDGECVAALARSRRTTIGINSDVIEQAA